MDVFILCDVRGQGMADQSLQVKAIHSRSVAQRCEGIPAIVRRVLFDSDCFQRLIQFHTEGGGREGEYFPISFDSAFYEREDQGMNGDDSVTPVFVLTPPRKYRPSRLTSICP